MHAYRAIRVGFLAVVVLRVQHSFQGVSGLPEDQYVNTWYFNSLTAPEGSDLPDLAAAVQGFYADVPSIGGSSVAAYMATTSDSENAHIKIYDMADEIPREPLYDAFYNPGAHGGVGGNTIPTELAVCLSYSAAPASGVPMARRRGRLFLGPWQQSAISSSNTTNAVVNPLLQTAILGAASDLAATSSALGWVWCVHSTAGAFAAPIATAWVDDAWDIQRRRGIKPTSRQTLAI